MKYIYIFFIFIAYSNFVLVILKSSLFCRIYTNPELEATNPYTQDYKTL